MPFYITTATKKIQNLKKRIKALQGGTSASKTVSVLLILIDKAQTDKKTTLTSIVSESMPHLKRGAIKDFLTIMKEQEYFEDKRWNRSDFTYTFESGSKLEFFSADSPDKLRGARRERLFLNECNNIPREAFEQLEVRTLEEIYLDWNPTNEFWFYELQNERDDIDHIILTYKDNEALDYRIVESIEKRKTRKGWWQVYGLGQLGEVEGKVFKDWSIINEIPHEAKLVIRGLDFGYSNDPTAIVDIYKYNDGYILNERCYQKGLSNKQIADLIGNLEEPQTLVIADSAEPKSIDEIASYGINILGAKKGKDSVNNGIQFVKDQRISITKRSTNLIKEYRNYLWITDKNGKILNKPEDIWNHLMDATRYGFSGSMPNKDDKIYTDFHQDIVRDCEWENI